MSDPTTVNLGDVFVTSGAPVAVLAPRWLGDRAPGGRASKANGRESLARHGAGDRRHAELSRVSEPRTPRPLQSSAAPPPYAELAKAHTRAPSLPTSRSTGAGVELREELIVPELEASDKLGALRQVACHLCYCARHTGATSESILAALLKREQLGSTGVGAGVAIPHARISGLRTPVACFARAPAGVPFDAIDAEPVHFIFALLVPDNAAAAHVRALACVSRILMDQSFRDRLCQHATRGAIYRDFVDAGLGEQWNVVAG